MTSYLSFTTHIPAAAQAIRQQGKHKWMNVWTFTEVHAQTYCLTCIRTIGHKTKQQTRRHINIYVHIWMRIYVCVRDRIKLLYCRGLKFILVSFSDFVLRLTKPGANQNNLKKVMAAERRFEISPIFPFLSFLFCVEQHNTACNGYRERASCEVALSTTNDL